MEENGIRIADAVANGEKSKKLVVFINPLMCCETADHDQGRRAGLAGMMSRTGSSIPARQSLSIWDTLPTVENQNNTSETNAKPTVKVITSYLLSYGSEYGVHMLLIEESTKRIRKASQDHEQWLTRCRHRIAFTMPSSSDVNVDFETAVSRKLKEKESCALYGDGIETRIIEPYSLP